MIHKKIAIKGIVQGVGFRYAARRMANQFGITGRVMNLTDGSVLIEAEGTEENMKRFIAWCHIGPSRSDIRSVIVEDEIPRNYSSFEIVLR